MGERQLVLCLTKVEKKVWKQECRRMWQDIFQDEDAYMEYYDHCKWRENQVWVLVDGEEKTHTVRQQAGEETEIRVTPEKHRLCAMLHLNPYRVKWKNQRQALHYIVGVCTREEYRHRGYMAKVLRCALEKMCQQEEPWTYLMPAAEEIYLPFGFVPVSRVKPVVITGEMLLGVSVTGAYEVKSYQSLEKREKKALCELCQRLLEGQHDIFVLHDEAFFEEKVQEMQACGGEVLVCLKSGKIIGYMEYMFDSQCEPAIESPEWMIDKSEMSGAEPLQFIKLLHGEICKRKGVREKEISILLSETGFLPEQLRACVTSRQEKTLIMARVVNFREAAGQLHRPEGWPQELLLHIEDDILPDNSGLWYLCFREDVQASKPGCFVEKLSEADEGTHWLPVYSLSVGEFARILFAQESVYINDLV